MAANCSGAKGQNCMNTVASALSNAASGVSCLLRQLWAGELIRRV